jgi:hypothetical protein
MLHQELIYTAHSTDAGTQLIGVVNGAVGFLRCRATETLNVRRSALYEVEQVRTDNGKGMRFVPEALTVNATGSLGVRWVR